MSSPPPDDKPLLQPVPLRPPAPPAVQRIDSTRLFAGAQEVQIEHRGVLYRLKQTSLGKLILTK